MSQRISHDEINKELEKYLPKVLVEITSSYIRRCHICGKQLSESITICRSKTCLNYLKGILEDAHISFLI